MIVEKIINTTQAEKLDIVGATLLSMEELELVPEEIRKYRCSWWTRSSGYRYDSAATVFNIGSVYKSGYVVNFLACVVRPALKISNIKFSNFKIGDRFVFKDKEFQIVSDELAFCLEDIGYYYFNKDCRCNESNDYDKSDIKKYVDGWFN